MEAERNQSMDLPLNLHEIMQFPRELTTLSIIIRIVLSATLGGIIGMERGMKNRPAGLRTYMLVCLGACIVMITNVYIFQVYDTGDPVRMGAQVISGIGFLGAGTIMITPHNQVKGLTTAAGLWTSACLGLAIGIGFFEVAVIGALAVILILGLLHFLDYQMRHRTRTMEVYVELSPETSLGMFMQYVRDHEIEVSNIQPNKSKNAAKISSYILTLTTKKRMNHETVIQQICDMEGVVYIQAI